VSRGREAADLSLATRGTVQVPTSPAEAATYCESSALVALWTRPTTRPLRRGVLLLGPVDGCPPGTTPPRHLEVGLRRLPPLLGRALWQAPSPRGAPIAPSGGAPAPELWCGGRPLGNSVGAIGWPPGPCAASLQGPGGRGLRLPISELRCPARGVPSRPRGPASKTVTWLILPVVICLSQRLSHACLSISNLYSETANGSLNQLSFI
jgi:hypothetical protein